MSEGNGKSLRNRTVFYGKLTVAELVIAVSVVFGMGVNYSAYNNALAEGNDERQDIVEKHSEDMQAIHDRLGKMEEQSKEDMKEVKDDVKQINQNIFKILRAVK